MFKSIASNSEFDLVELGREGSLYPALSLALVHKYVKTRMHSSRMRTARSLTVSHRKNNARPPPGSNHACPPEQPHTPPPGATTHPPEQPRMPSPEQPRMPPPRSNHAHPPWSNHAHPPRSNHARPPLWTDRHL